MSSERTEPLRVLIANERPDRLEVTTKIVEKLGHVVIARELQVSDVAAMTAHSMPDVALVAIGESTDHALRLISSIVQEAACPVIALLEVEDPTFIKEAARRGVFAYIADGEADELESALDIVLERFAEFRNLEGAFGRRGFGPTSIMTICFETCTCGAARPAPSYSYMVSITSSMNCWMAGVKI